MKFEFKWPSGFWRNYVLMCWWDSNMRDLGWKAKGQPWPLKLIYSHWPIWFNISRENNDFGLNSFQKMKFSKKIPFKCIRKQIWPWSYVGQGQLRFNILNKLGRSHIPNATYQVPRSSAFWFWRRRFLNGFYHIWAWRPSWSCDHNIMYKFWLTYHKESIHESWVQLGKWFVRKLCFNILMGLQYERPKLTGQRSTLTFWTYL